jgi:hypothetical protein
MENLNPIPEPPEVLRQLNYAQLNSMAHREISPYAAYGARCAMAHSDYESQILDRRTSTQVLAERVVALELAHNKLVAAEHDTDTNLEAALANLQTLKTMPGLSESALCLITTAIDQVKTAKPN